MNMDTDAGVTVAEIERLYRSHFHQYLRVAEAIAGDPDGGFDAVQDGFARAIRYRATFRHDASLSTWVWRCVVNAARAVRRSSAVSGGATDEPLEGVESSFGDLRESIATLPERQRVILFLRYYADMDYATIAKTLHLRTGTVGAALNKAHATLRRNLQEVPQ